jgi:ribosomal protein L2
MGKRLIAQRRGRGNHRFKATHRAVAKAEYISWEKAQQQPLARAQVVGLALDPGRSALLAKLLYEDKSTGHVVAAEGFLRLKRFRETVELSSALQAFMA